MNILLINTLDVKGGAAKVAYGLKAGLEKHGNTVSLFVKLKHSNDPDVHVMKWPNPVSKAVKRITGKDIGSILANKIRPWLANDINFFKSDRILDTKEFREADIVHCHNLHGNYFNLSTLEKMVRQKPVLWTLHDMWAVTPYCAHTKASTPADDGFYNCDVSAGYPTVPALMARFMRSQKRRIYSKTKHRVHLITPCNWLKKKVQPSILGKSALSVIYNGVDTSVFAPRDKQELRRELGLPADKTLLLFVSAIGHGNAKGWNVMEDVIDYFNQNNNVSFISIGGRTRTDAPHVLQRNYITDEKLLAQYYAAADIFILPSPAETFPLTALEALSCGLPVAAFDVGGLPELVEHKSEGYLAKSGDTADLIRGIEFILNLNDQEKKRMAEKSRAKVTTQFNLETMVQKHIELYNSLMTKK